MNADPYPQEQAWGIVDERDLPVFIHSELDDIGLSLEAFRVYGHLARRRNKTTKTAWPSYATIGEKCFRTNYPNANTDTLRRKAMAAVKELSELGLILIRQRKGPDGGWTSNEFVLTPRSSWKIPPDQPLVSMTPPPHTPGVIDTTLVSMTPPNVIDTQRISIEGYQTKEVNSVCVEGESSHTPITDRPTALTFDAVQIFIELTDIKRPNKDQACLMANWQQTANPDLDKWRYTIGRWRQQGWKDGNIQGMIDRYNRGWDDLDSAKNGGRYASQRYRSSGKNTSSSLATNTEGSDPSTWVALHDA